MQTKCYFCTQEITGLVEYHHPNKTHHPDWTEPAHPECHTRYHREAGHFQFWGAESSYVGRPGYARAAEQDERGRFVGETEPVYGLGTPFQIPSAIVRRAYRERVQAQTEKRFWYSQGFEWRPRTSTWERDTRRPLRGKVYTPAT